MRLPVSIAGRFGLGLALLLVLAILLGGLVIERTWSIGAVGETLLRHPFVVANTALEARLDVAGLRDDFDDLRRARSADATQGVVARIAAGVMMGEEKLKILTERYLGDPAEITAVRAALAQCQELGNAAAAKGRAEDWNGILAIIEAAQFTCLPAAERHLAGIIAFAKHKADRLAAEVATTRRHAFLLTVPLVGVILAIGGLIGWRIFRDIAVPMIALRQTMRRIVEGDAETAVPYRDAPGEVGEMAEALDVLRLNMAERLRADADLRNALAELTRANQELAESNRDLDAFAHAASHDLQEPLRMVSNYVQLIERRLGEALTPEIAQSVAFAVAGTRRMRILILDLLDYARLRRSAARMAALPLAEVVGTALTALQPELDKAKVKVTVGHLPSVRGDEVQLERLFYNLIDNAIIYHHADRIPFVAISAERRDGDWLIAVADNGIGIAPQYQEQIFQPFKRLHTHEVYEGSGLGLSVVRHIVEQHGGRIWVESDHGQGSRFCFTLPASDGPSSR